MFVRHQVSLCSDDILGTMKDFGVGGALHSTKKLFDNGTAREGFLGKLRETILDPDNGVSV